MDSLSQYLPAFGAGGYVLSRPQLTESRFRWLWRTQAAGLIECGAVIKMGDRLYVHPGRADAFIVEHGRRAALNGVRPESGVIAA